jgi:hypothetical protein
LLIKFSFWSGYRSSIILTANPSISYYLFEVFKDKFVPAGQSPQSHQIFLCSAVAKAIATTFTYPFILTKARMQASPKRNDSPFKRIIETLKNPSAAGGWQPLFEGLEGQIIKGFFAQGFLLMFKDHCSRLILFLLLARQRLPKPQQVSEELSSVGDAISQAKGQVLDAVNSEIQSKSGALAALERQVKKLTP